jgi:hypothetical protein
MNNPENRSCGIFLCWVAGVIVLLPFFIISFYNHPLGDDYWCTSLVRRYGYWNAQIRLYNIVPPRYTALAVSCLTPLSFGNFFGYKIIPVAFFLLFIFVTGRLFGNLYSNRIKGGLRYLPGLIFAAIYLSVLPGIGEGIYWSSALSVYQTGIVLFIVLAGALLNWYYNKQKRAAAFAIACLSLVGIMGCNEIISVISLILVAAIALYKKLSKGRIDTLLIVLLVLSVISVAFIMRFKGLGDRYAMIQTSHSGLFLYSAGLSLLGTGYHIILCLINPFFWAIAVAAFEPFLRFARLCYTTRRELFDHPKYFLSIWLLILFIIPFSIIYLTGEKPPLRVSNMIIFFFLLGLVYLGTLASNGRIKVIRPGKLFTFLERYKIVVVGFLLIAGFLSPNNVSVASGELISGMASRYNDEMNERYRLVGQCNGDSCVVPPLKDISRILRYSPADYCDQHFWDYFNKKVLVSGSGH